MWYEWIPGIVFCLILFGVLPIWTLVYLVGLFREGKITVGIGFIPGGD